ncbi:Glycine dehydrogenase [decarboxylating] [Mycobacteroides abscessus subsp. massiliense]|nr:Glycine dehydrogenase [decarboxylating] [Mycobacteroides abscessus subsp. massiliense]
MLATIGVASLDELAEKAVPASILDELHGGLATGLDALPAAASEHEALDALRKLASHNTIAVSMIGQGYFDTLTPPVLRRHILENGSAAELPDHGLRAHRPGHRECLDAR